MSEFRALSFPDSGVESVGTKVLCTRDPEAKKKFYLDTDYLLLGDRADAQCSFYKYGEHPVLFPKGAWYESRLRVATVNVNATYLFVTDGSDVQRLYKIAIRSDVRHWPTFWEAYSGRYGQPSKISRDPWRSRMGAAFDNVVATWENAESAIILVMRAEEVEISRIWYIHKGLRDLLDSRDLAKKGRPKDNL